MSRHRKRLVVEFDVAYNDPPMSDFKKYIEDAVGSWGGQFHPDDPLFAFHDRNVKVTQYQRLPSKGHHRAKSKKPVALPLSTLPPYEQGES